jgi:hypothetical protein
MLRHPVHARAIACPKTNMKRLTVHWFGGVLATITVTLVITGCSSRSNPPADSAQLQIPAPDVVTRTSVAALLGTDDCAPVGLTITPDTDQLVLLDARQGVYVLDSERHFQRVISRVQLHQQVTADSEFSDIAGIGSNQFAITATNDGFLLDLDDGSLRQHFCYVPGSIINPTQIVQHTDSVAFDPLTGRILAQPVTYSNLSAVPGNALAINSEVGTFPITGGEGTDWHAIGEVTFLAGAITVDQNGVLWLARGDELFHYNLGTDSLTLVQSLARFNVSEVSGMVFDGNDLMVLDAVSREILCIPGSLL